MAKCLQLDAVLQTSNLAPYIPDLLPLVNLKFSEYKKFRSTCKKMPIL